MSEPTVPNGDRRSARQDPTVRSLRARNRSVALTHLIRAGTSTRAELGAACGLSPASATNIVGDLIAEGLVAETGLLASQGGRPTAQLAPVADGAYLIGADVGERGVAVELFDLSMRRIDREFRGGSMEESPDAIGHDLSDAVEALRLRNVARWPRVVGVGLGLPGIVETDDSGEQVLFPESLGWPPVAIRPLLVHDLPLLAENGAKTQAKAEQWYGAARSVDHALVALLGRGVGLGVIVDGEVYRGHASSAAEWGHVSLDRNGPICRCGRRGCVEAFLGAQAILDRWAAAGGAFEGTGWGAIGRLLEADAAGDASASAVIDEVVGVLGTALGGLVNLYNPERVIIGGWVGMRLMERLAPRIDAATRAAALREPGSQFTLLPCTFGGDTVALGAAIMPLELLVSAPLAEEQSRAARSVG